MITNIQKQTLTNLLFEIKDINFVIVCDKKLKNLYKNKIPSTNIIFLDAGEFNKKLNNVTKLYKFFIKSKIDRHSKIVAIGGGCICDITGFAASTFMRGVPFIFVPTTLLAVVDAAMGGKNAVNFLNYKNLIGTFNQPEKIVHDFSFLKTLKEQDVKCGVAEIIKHALIADSELFKFLNTNIKNILILEDNAINRVVADSVRIKMNIVDKDEKEKNIRKLLNFGHTLGHALENVLKISHGKAVSKGMYFALKLSKKMNLINESDYRVSTALISNFGFSDFIIPKNKLKKIIDALKKDKKKNADKISFVLLTGIGSAKIEDLDIKFIEGAIYDLC